MHDLYNSINIAKDKEKAENDFKNTKELLNRFDIMDNKDYNFLYPSLDDPNFNIKISEKKEFFDTATNITVVLRKTNKIL